MPSTKTKPKTAAYDATTRQVREWARGKSLEVGTHGLISDQIRDAYNKTHRAHQFAGSHRSTKLG